MISHELRQAILVMQNKGVPLREISRVLKVSRNAVRRVVREPTPRTATHCCKLHEEIIQLIPEMYRRCKGNAVRIQEILREEHAVELPYSSLTRLLRELALRSPKRRSGIYHFAPGAELQHDTSPHRLQLGEKMITAQCASLVLAYSRTLYFQYYPQFTRFEAKAFLTEALRQFDGSCPRCTIDNTSVVLAGGSGPDALIAPEMEAFGELFSMRFIPHAIGHSDRKARVERPFSYIEGNFLAGRTFADWCDLNTQARQWCDNYANAKPRRALGMSSQAAWVMEKPYLLALPSHIPEVVQIHHRVVDTQGYVHLDCNRYSVPERLLGEPVEVHKQLMRVLIFHRRRQVASHLRQLNKKDSRVLDPSHHSVQVKRKISRDPSSQERSLRDVDPCLDAYVTALKLRAPGQGVTKFRKLLALQRDYPTEPFLMAVRVALKYGLFDLNRLERIIMERVSGDFFNLEDHFDV